MKSLTVFFVMLMMFVGLFTGPLFAAELNWTAPQLVMSSPGGFGRDLDLELDHQGNFHLAIANDGANSIWYCKWVEPTWTIKEEAAAITGDGGFYFSLGLFGAFPVITFTDNFSGNMMWTMRTGSSWSTPDFVTGTYNTYFVRSLVDSFGAMHVLHLFRPGGGDSIWYSTDKSGSWVHESVAAIANPGYVVKTMDFALDSAGNPHFVWWDSSEDAVFYSVRTGASAYTTTNVAPADTCKWIELVILDGDFPYFGWTNIESSGDYTINDCFKIGSSFYNGVVVTSSQNISATGMAIATEEGFTVSNLYFLYSNIDNELRYVHWVGGTGWVNEVIEEVAMPGAISSISAKWDAERNAVGVAIREYSTHTVYFLLGYVPTAPTPTPGPSPTPTPTGGPGGDIILDLGPDMDYGPGDMMSGVLSVENSGAAMGADVYVLLEVFGEFWFAPGWTQDLDLYSLSLLAGEVRDLIYLPEFMMPDPLPTGGPFYFYAAAFSPDTLEADTIISNVEIKEFNLI